MCQAGFFSYYPMVDVTHTITKIGLKLGHENDTHVDQENIKLNQIDAIFFPYREK